MKKTCVISLVIVMLMSGVNISYGAPQAIQYAETDQELIDAERRLDSIILKMQDEHLKNYKDFQEDASVEVTVGLIKEKGYPINKEFLALSYKIESYKKKNPHDDLKKVVKHFNQQAGLKDKAADKKLSIQFTQIAHALSYGEWTVLTTAEKLLIAANPSKALMTNSIKQVAFNYTAQKFGYNGLGDSSDGYRHGMWSALMTRDISRAWAEAYGNAHEDRPTTELQARQADGYTGYQHKAMDLANNKVGRDAIKWYEYYFNCWDSTVKSRISAKLTNTAGNIVWLHN
ncbi:MAG: hypothetical protein M3Q73_03110 [bacterium]|nr:hypothetical protein [bacterium]